MMKRSMVTLFLVATLGLTIMGCSKKEPVQETPTETADVAEEATDTDGIPVATVDEVKEALASDSAVVLDARQQEVYSGWSIYDNQGGHIDGASNFAANWFVCAYDDENNLDSLTRDEQLARKMEDKGISADTPVIVYDNNGEDAQVVANYLVEQGVSDVKTFDLSEWTEDLATYENYEIYVPATVIEQIINGETIEEIGEFENPIIIEVSWGGVEESGYLNGHVPGALHINSDEFDQPELGYLLQSDEVLFDLAESRGITKDSNVIVTGDSINSCRYAIILKYLGCENVYVMSGGFNGWTNAGLELETTENTPVPVDDFGLTEPARPEVIVTVDEAEEILKSDDSLLIDNRTIEEYNGEISGYSYYDMCGRIEGAVFGKAGEGNSSSMLFYRNPDATMRDASEIQAMWTELGVDTNKHLSFFCGNGYRASEILWDAWMMGDDNTSLYADGWIGWSSAGNDYVTGSN